MYKIWENVREKYKEMGEYIWNQNKCGHNDRNIEKRWKRRYIRQTLGKGKLACNYIKTLDETEFKARCIIRGK